MLIFAFGQNLQSAMSNGEVNSRLDLETLLEGKSWMLQTAQVQLGSRGGVSEGIAWLYAQMNLDSQPILWLPT